MRQTIFSKELTFKGKHQSGNAVISATMNYGIKEIFGTHALTHDSYSKNVPKHKVEAYVSGKLWKKIDDLTSEKEVLDASEKLINETKIYIEKLKNEEPPTDTFEDKMRKIFS